MIKRNLKVLGLALMATFALSVVAASAAQAAEEDKFTATKYPTAITGHQEGATNFLGITENKFKIGCEVATYEGTLTEASAEITIHPHYEGCKAEPLGVAAIVDLNGCHFTFTIGETVAGNSEGKAHVLCPVGKQIEVTNGGLCTVDIPPQTIESGITYTNKPAVLPETPEHYITVDLNVSGLKYKETKNSIFCPFTNNFEGTDGTFVSSVYIKGYEDLGTHVGEPTGLSTNTEGKPVGIDVGKP